LDIETARQVSHKFLIVTARSTAQAVVQMGSDQFEIKLFAVTQFRQCSYQGCRVGSAGYTDYGGFVLDRKSELSPFSDQVADKFVHQNIKLGS
jgi:hypothetical protein